MRIQHLNHSTYQFQYHLVWGTKYRTKYLQSYVKPELIHSFYATCKKYSTLYIQTVNTDQDHVHFQIEMPPNIRVSDAVQKLKSNSSFYLKKKFKFIREMYIEDSIWSVGYFASTIGLNEAQIKKYIEYQGKQEQPQTLRLWNQPKLQL